MKNARFWRNVWFGVAAVCAATGAAALAVPDHGAGFKPYVALAVPTLAIGAMALIAATMLAAAARRFDRLDRGENVLARWRIDPATWRDFVGADQVRESQMEPRWKVNAVAASGEIVEPIEIVVSREAVRIGESYHELDKMLLQGTRFLAGAPVMLEFFFTIPKPRGPYTYYVVRFPVAHGAEQQAQDVLAYFNAPVEQGPLARAIMAPGRAARRNPRRARNVALLVAAIGACVAALASRYGQTERARAWEYTDPVADLAIAIMAGSIGVAIVALVVAVAMHMRARG